MILAISLHHIEKIEVNFISLSFIITKVAKLNSSPQIVQSFQNKVKHEGYNLKPNVDETQVTPL